MEESLQYLSLFSSEKKQVKEGMMEVHKVTHGMKKVNREEYISISHHT